MLIGRRSLLRDIIDSVTPTLFRRTSTVKIVNVVFEKYNLTTDAELLITEVKRPRDVSEVL